MKHAIMSTFALIGGATGYLIGGWSMILEILLIFMALDYVSGLVVALVFKSSTKSESGAFTSEAGLKGLFKKGGMLVMILAAHQLDRALGVTMVKDAVILAFIVNETFSLVEKAGLMGVPIPAALTQAIEVLNDKTSGLKDKTESGDGK